MLDDDDDFFSSDDSSSSNSGSGDSYTESTSESWFGRMGDSIKGILVGLVLVVIAFPVLFWNEGRAVQTAKTLEEGGKAVVSVSADKVDPSNAGKLIHVAAKATTDATLKDPMFSVSAPALKLKRVVEQYLWKETQEKKTEKKLGGGSETITTYKYTQVWSEKPIDSSSFKKAAEHKNPATMPFESSTWTADPIKLGAFKLSASLAAKLENYTPFSVPAGTAVPKELGANGKLDNNGFFQGENPMAPKTGDIRVMYKTVQPSDVSVIARQVEGTFEPYTTKAGGKIEMLETGIRSAEAMFKAAEEANKALTWILRLVGFVVMFIGFKMLMKPLSVLVDIIPFLGGVVEFGTGIIAFLISSMLSFITIGVAWVVYRPLIGILMFGIALGLLTLWVMMSGKKKTA